MLSAEATNTNFIVFGLTRPGSNPQSTALETGTLTSTPPMWYKYSYLNCCLPHKLLSSITPDCRHCQNPVYITGIYHILSYFLWTSLFKCPLKNLIHSDITSIAGRCFPWSSSKVKSRCISYKYNFGSFDWLIEWCLMSTLVVFQLSWHYAELSCGISYKYQFK